MHPWGRGLVGYIKYQIICIQFYSRYVPAPGPSPIFLPKFILPKFNQCLLPKFSVRKRAKFNRNDHFKSETYEILVISLRWLVHIMVGNENSDPFLLKAPMSSSCATLKLWVSLWIIHTNYQCLPMPPRSISAPPWAPPWAPPNHGLPLTMGSL